MISASDAAGYRDFIRHLDENPYGFKVDPELFPALMQGAECPSSIIAALDAVLESGKSYDAVLILRGPTGLPSPVFTAKISLPYRLFPITRFSVLTLLKKFSAF